MNIKSLLISLALVIAAPQIVQAQQLALAGTPLNPDDVGSTDDFIEDVASATVPGGGLVDYKDVINPNSEFYKRSQTFQPSDPKNRAIYNAARGVGIRAGFADEAKRINAILKSKYANYLNGTFNFRSLMIEQYVVPPVVTEITNVEEQQGGEMLYFSNSAFEILKDARLARRAPHWQEYLILPIQPPAAPRGISVETKEEEATWRDGARTGWYAGIMQARSGFVTAWNIVNRDFGGMQRYHQLAQQGVVSLPDVRRAVAEWRVTEGGVRAYRGERTLRLHVSPRFKR